MATQYRQGDVFLIATTDAVPPGAHRVPRDQGRVVLAYGEVTGHAHALLEPEVELFTTTADAADRWLRVGGTGATVVHEEHGPITLTPGVYRVRRQREYTPAEVRLVAD